jgi:hypothetical protein
MSTYVVVPVVQYLWTILKTKDIFLEWVRCHMPIISALGKGWGKKTMSLRPALGTQRDPVSNKLLEWRDSLWNAKKSLPAIHSIGEYPEDIKN